jgi:phage terminase large subunit-like protein
VTAATLPLLGRQEPTFLWVPPHDDSLGDAVIELAASAGLILDPWQQLLVRSACAVDPFDMWSCFEIGIMVSRQNGKGAVLAALELAWLFMFGDEWIIHSAHLFETSRLHFLKMQALITNSDDFRRRVKRMREGRGSEEIELITGQHLKFMTRKGGAGRGFTGNKVVLDEAMYLDADMMAAALPTLSAVPNAQVIYTGSAGMKHSTQLGLVRRRGMARNEPALMYAEWAGEKAVYDAQGDLVSGDDPADPATWAKTNPGFGIRLTETKTRNEMRAFGGPRSQAFEQERLGIGDWPEDEETWEVITKPVWDSRGDPTSKIPDDAPVALAIDADEERSMGTIGVCGEREDGRRHVEIIDRRRGTGWIVDRAKELRDRHKVRAVVVLKTSTAASLIKALVDAGLPVHSPSEGEYAQACGQFFEAVVELGTVRHIDQKSMNSAVGGARKRTNVEGGWRWSREGTVDAGPIVTPTLALWGFENFSAPEPEIFI